MDGQQNRIQVHAHTNTKTFTHTNTKERILTKKWKSFIKHKHKFEKIIIDAHVKTLICKVMP
jgi:hypothetical protein